MSTPAGVVAFLFTDLVGSTELIDQLGDDAAEELRRTHFSLLRGVVAASGGEEVKSLGDGLMISFTSPLQAVGCAVDMQRVIADHNRRRSGPSLGVRIGVHAGEPVREEGDFFGAAVVVAKRLCERAHGGQILASELVAGLVGSRGGFRFRSLGAVRLKGLSQPVAAVSVEWGQSEAIPKTSSSPAPTRGPVPRGPAMVGRDRELHILENELGRTSGGEFRVVLLTADPGVGKTRPAAANGPPASRNARSASSSSPVPQERKVPRRSFTAARRDESAEWASAWSIARNASMPRRAWASARWSITHSAFHVMASATRSHR